jgi:hypothetical protein
MKYSSAVEGYTPVDRGLIPDIEIEPSIEDVLVGHDTVLEYTLRMIRESG